MKIYTKSSLFLKNKLKNVFKKALIKTNNTLNNIAVGIKFVDDNEIRMLNKEHRGVDKVTDVLSFPMYEIKVGERIEKALLPTDMIEEEIYLGDIVICKNKIYSQAKEYGLTKKRELYYLALHSFLHLLGYDHQNEEEERRMFGLTEEILGYGRKICTNSDTLE